MRPLATRLWRPSGCSEQIFKGAISEVLHLLSTENVDVVLVGADVVNGRERAVQLGSIAIILEPSATIKEVLWELELLFPGGISIQ